MAILTAGGFLRRGRRRAVRVHHFHFCPFGQTIDTVSNHPVTRRQPGGNHHLQTVLNTRRDGVLADFILIVQYPDEMAFIAHLQCGSRDDDGVLFRVYQHTGVHELVREQGVVLVVKARFQFDGPGGGVNLVIQTQQRPFADFLFVGPVPGLNLQRFPGFLRLDNGRDIIFRQREDQIVWVNTTMPVVSLLEI